MKVAVIMAQIDGYYQKTLMNGILLEADKHDISLDVYTNFHVTDLYPNMDVRHFAGEKSIFLDIPFEAYDGLIVCFETIRYREDMRQWMQDEIRKKMKGPVISLDNTNQYFDNVLHDDAEAMATVVHHLCEKHGYTEYAFLAGPKEHPHSVMREKGFIRGLEECGILCDKDRIYEGNFWYDSGEELAEMLIREGKLPRALVCASESMAIGAYRKLIENGIRVPEDVAVTGFDALDEGIDEDYSITSMIRDSEDEGRESIREIYMKVMGEEEPPIEKKPSPLLVRASCGCVDSEFTFSNRGSVAPLRPVNYGRYNNFYSNYNYMLENLVEAPSFAYCAQRLLAYLRYLEQFRYFEVCLYENWKEADRKDEFVDTRIFIEYCADGEKKEAQAPHQMTKKGMEMEAIKRTQSKVSYYAPIYFEKKVMGYSVLRYEEAKLPPECYSAFHKNINVGLYSNAKRKESE